MKYWRDILRGAVVGLILSPFVAQSISDAATVFSVSQAQFNDYTSAGGGRVTHWQFTNRSSNAVLTFATKADLIRYLNGSTSTQLKAVNLQSQINQKVNKSSFTNNSTYTAAHIRSVSPYGNHPAAGSDKQLQVNGKGVPTGAAYLQYSSPYTSVPGVTGRFSVGTTNPDTQIQVVSEFGGVTRGISAVQATGDTQGANIAFRKYRGTFSSPAPVQNGDVIGAFNGYVWNNDATPRLERPVQFGFITDGVITGPDSPGAISFSTGTGAFAGTSRPISVRMLLDSYGVLKFQNSGGLPYGQMYSNTSTTITVAASGTWYEVDTGATDFTAGRLKNVTQTDHYLVAPTAGDYLINAAASFGTTAAGDEIALSVMINGVASATCHGHATVVTATTTVPSSCVTILSLAANDQVSLAVQNHSAARNITLSHSQLSILHVGSP